MTQDITTGLASIVVLGVSAQWLAWRFRIPSILILLTMGIVAGPLTGFLDPDALLGSLILPLVSLSVAIILFEGGLSLKIHELREIGGVLLRLSSIGVAVSWILITVSAHYLLRLAWPLSSLLGAVLVVTGPTVIGPLLRHLRLGGQVAAILKWEGIVIDPVGAILALVVFTILHSRAAHEAARDVLIQLGLTVVVGIGLGALGVGLLLIPLRNYRIPDSLQSPGVLACVFALFILANKLQPESGLLAVTAMGVGLANQRSVPVKHLIEFKENLTVLLISNLFIILAARLEPVDLHGLGLKSFVFVAVLIVVIRPLSVFLSTYPGKLNWRERLFLCCMAPRGIVAASIMSVFALEMAEAGYARSERLVPVTFLVVFVTVLFYGLGGMPLARWLGLANPNPQGILFVGADPLVRSIALALQKEGCPVLLVDTDQDNLSNARMLGLPTHFGSILAEQLLQEVNFGELGRLVAMTSNNEVNSLACLRFVDVFGRAEVYQLSVAPHPVGRHEPVSLEQRGRFLFGPQLTAEYLAEHYGSDPVVRVTRLTNEFKFADYQARHGPDVLPLLLLKPKGEVIVLTSEGAGLPQPGDALISLFPPPKESVHRESDG